MEMKESKIFKKSWQ